MEAATSQSLQMARMKTTSGSSYAVTPISVHPLSRKAETKSKDSVKANHKLLLKCKFCSGKHLMQKAKCPAYGKICNNCGEENHYALCCSKSRNGNFLKSKNEVKSLRPSDEYSYRLNGKIHAYCFLIINGVRRRFLIGTGSSRDIIPKYYVLDMKGLRPAADLRCYDGSIMKPLGELNLDVYLPDGEIIQ
ncbi:Uncharacterised protein r2_g305 [Pycnogonum litorale]